MLRDIGGLLPTGYHDYVTTFLLAGLHFAVSPSNRYVVLPCLRDSNGLSTFRSHAAPITAS